MPRGLRRRRLPDREPVRVPARRPGRLRHVRGRQHRAAAARGQAPARRLRQGVPDVDVGGWPATSWAGPPTRPSTARRCARVAQIVADGGDRRRSARSSCSDTETQRELLTDRVETMVAEVGAALRPAQKAPRAEAAAPVQRAPERAHRGRPGARRTAAVGGLHRGAGTVDGPGHPAVLTWLRDLFGLTLIERNLAWYLMNGRLSDAARPDGESLHQPPADPAPPARAGPGRRVRVRPGARPRGDRHGRREASGRTRPASTTGRCARPARSRCRRSTSADRGDDTSTQGHDPAPMSCVQRQTGSGGRSDPEACAVTREPASAQASRRRRKLCVRPSTRTPSSASTTVPAAPATWLSPHVLSRRRTRGTGPPRSGLRSGGRRRRARSSPGTSARGRRR